MTEREIDQREADGGKIVVTLYHDFETDLSRVAIVDGDLNHEIGGIKDKARAIEIYNHPFVYYGGRDEVVA